MIEYTTTNLKSPGRFSILCNIFCSTVYLSLLHPIFRVPRCSICKDALRLFFWLQPQTHPSEESIYHCYIIVYRLCIWHIDLCWWEKERISLPLQSIPHPQDCPSNVLNPTELSPKCSVSWGTVPHISWIPQKLTSNVMDPAGLSWDLNKIPVFHKFGTYARVECLNTSSTWHQRYAGIFWAEWSSV